MKTRFHQTIVAALLVLAGTSALLIAANVDKALTDADGRRKAAENGLREIKAKSREQAEQVRPLYAEAASRNNAWLDVVCQSIQQDLTEIASETWKANREANEQKRMKTATALKERLQWRSWEEVQ